MIAFLLIVAMVGNVFAQERTITGTVTSADDGLELPGASVIVPGTQLGTVTDVSGRYSLSVPEGTTQLEFSFI